VSPPRCDASHGLGLLPSGHLSLNLAPYRFSAPRPPFPRPSGFRPYDLPLSCCQERFNRSPAPPALQSAQVTVAFVVSDLGSSPRIPGSLQRQHCESTYREPSHDPLSSALGLSQPLDGLLLAAPRSPISCYRHSWDSQPSRAFPSTEAAPCSHGRCLHDVPCFASRLRRVALRSPASPRPCSPVESVSFQGGLDLENPDTLLGFLPSKVLPLPAVKTLSRLLLPWASPPGLTVTLAVALRSITERGARLTSPEAADPLGVCYLAPRGCR